MARKLNKSAGKAVIYTKDGVKVVDSDVRRLFNINQDSCIPTKNKALLVHVKQHGGETLMKWVYQFNNELGVSIRLFHIKVHPRPLPSS